MKTFRFIMLSIGIVLASLTFNSCLDDDGYSLGDVWRSIATIDSNGDGSAHYYRLDDGSKLWPAAGNYTGHNLDDGQRIILYYTILSDKINDFDHYVKVVDVEIILTKPFAEDKGEENDEYYGTTPVQINKMYIGGGYLNVWFTANYGGVKKHFVNLVNRSDEENPYRFEFRHNAYDDPPVYSALGPVCFDLSELKTNGEAVELTVVVKTHDGDKEFKLEYDPSKETEESIPNSDQTGTSNNIE